MTELLPGMESEQRKPELSQWFTPPELSKRIVDWALSPLASRASVLEPSAGIGALASEIRAYGRRVAIDSPLCVEIDGHNCDRLLRQGFETIHGDFLRQEELPYSFDIAIMNPPFEGGQTERHILHALKFADRVVCHCPLTTLAGQARRESLWSKVQLHRLAICSTRPRYGAMNAGEERYGGKTDMCTIDVTLRMEIDKHAGTTVEWWP